MIPGYRVIRELGRGGMATVYLAEQESLGREVALKVLNPSLAADADFAERFLREARFAGSFRHRNLLPVYDAGRSGDHLFLAMEVVPGGHAGDLRGDDPEEIRRCLIEVASGLAHAHAKGVVHRDIKPENILRREDGSFVISDFGIARSTQATRELTGAQGAIGTPSYMSPEQWRGDAIDGRADIYSLGIVAFELLTGRTPFHGDDGWAIGMQHMTAARPCLPHALADWQPILDRTLAVDRNARFAQAHELIAALGGRPESTPGGGSTVRAQPALHTTTPIPAQRTGLPWILPVAALVLLLLGGIGYWIRRDSGPAAGQARAAAIDAKPDAKTAPAADKSIAVLPFRVLSTEPGDALFADGLSEEILSSFAAIPELKVPGRTSSFVWKDKPTDIREIARSLGVAHILEGSIRRAGDQLRITANLLNASDGTTLWSQTFDRSTEDVFAIQNEIAIAVTDRLAVQMGTRTLPTLARLPSAQRGAYLETIGALRTLPFDQMRTLVQKLRDLEASEEVGPDLYVRLLHLIGHLARSDSLGFAEAIAEQERYLNKLTARFPGSVEVLQGQALVVNSRGDASNRLADHEQALRLFQQVLARLPNDALAASQAAFVSRTLLRHAEAIALARRAVEIDPEDPVALFALANALGSAGQGDAAVAAMRELVSRFPTSTYRENLGQFLAGNGQLADSVMEFRRSCLASPERGFCIFAGRVLHLLGFQGSAVEMEAREPEAHQSFIRGFEALRDGDFPETGYARLYYLTMIEAMSEAAAQQRGDLVAAYSDAGWTGRRNGITQPDGVSASEFDLRPAVKFVAAAMIDADGEDAGRVRRDIEAVARMAKAMPPRTMPYPTVHWPLGAEILSGDLDAAFHRLDGLVEGNPLYWQYWVISPSGRDLPTAKILRADPRFDAIWARRAALIERERAKLRQLWPEVE